MKPLVSCGLVAVLGTGCGGSRAIRTQAPTPDDDVSVGYGTQSKRTTAVAVTSVTPNEADTRAGRIEDLLRARVPGLEVLPQGHGQYTLRIQAARSLLGDQQADEPLLVIDDVPVPAGSLGSALAGVAPRDVARIDVLKDAAATSVYGVRGGNGVIIITTKRAP